VDEFTNNGRQYASMYCTYSVKSGAKYVSSKYQFLLRKETSSGHWKILEFEPVTTESDSN
jgi:hypothetical protein